LTPAWCAHQLTNEPHQGNPSAFVNLPYLVKFSPVSTVPTSANATAINAADVPLGNDNPLTRL